MIEFNKRDLTAISRAVKKKQRLVSSTSQVWKRIHEEWNIGCLVEGKKYFIDDGGYRQLRRCVENTCGTDPLLYNERALKGDRIEAAGERGNEKHAKEAPNHNRIHVKSFSGIIALESSMCKLPPRTSLDIRFDEIPCPDSVIVCENLNVFNEWHKASLPPTLSDSLVCYRGNDVRAGNVSAWLKSIETRTHIIVFPDFDPSGIKLATDYPYHNHSLLVPILPRDLEPSIHDKKKYREQSRDMETVLRRTNFSRQLMARTRKMSSSGGGFTQELMFFSRIPLEIIPAWQIR